MSCIGGRGSRPPLTQTPAAGMPSVRAEKDGLSTFGLTSWGPHDACKSDTAAMAVASRGPLSSSPPPICTSTSRCGDPLTKYPQQQGGGSAYTAVPDTSTFGCRVVWQHSVAGGAGTWEDFHEGLNDGVEEAYCRGDSRKEFYISSSKYTVDFKTKRQKSGGGQSRVIRRHLLPPLEFAGLRHPALEHAEVVPTDWRPRDLPEYLPEEVQGRFEKLAEVYARLLGQEFGYRELPMPSWRDMDADITVAIAAASLALFRVGATRSKHVKVSFCCLRGDYDKVQDAFRRNLPPPPRVVLPRQAPLLPARHDSWDWVRTACDQASRKQRLFAACEVMCSFALTEPYAELVEGRDATFIPNRGRETQVEHDDSGLLLDIALRAISKYGKVAIVNASSAHQLGGGFLTGGRHALEEALCMQTTLYPSLVQASELAKKKRLVDHVGKCIHIPEHGCILSPRIEVLRGGTDTGYQLLPEPAMLAAVISLAMGNRNPALPGRDFRQGAEYDEMVKHKFQAMAACAIKSGAQALVVPDCGCHTFQNDPQTVGRLLGQVLGRVDGLLRRVILVGQPSFAKAAIDALSRAREARRTGGHVSPSR